MATGALERLEADIRSLQNELSQLNKQKQAVRQETAAAQRILEGEMGTGVTAGGTKCCSSVDNA